MCYLIDTKRLVIRQLDTIFSYTCIIIDLTKLSANCYCYLSVVEGSIMENKNLFWRYYVKFQKALHTKDYVIRF